MKVFNKVRIIFFFIILNIGGICFADKGEEISPYKILQKAASAFYAADSLKVVLETWLQSPLYHTHMMINNYIENADDSKVEGRVSFSFLVPGAEYSTSSWVQSYTIKGIPFSWNSKDRQWEKEILEIEEGEDVEKIQYSLLSSLFYVNEETTDPSTVRLLGTEEREGRKCFVIGYKFDKEMFNKWGLTADVSNKIWIDVDSFQTIASRTEGRLGDLNLLQTAEYKNYNIKEDFGVPVFISDEVSKEKGELEKKIKSLNSAVAGIRGWDRFKLYDVKVEFVKRGRMRQVISEEFDKFYSNERIKWEEKIFNWLSLIPSQTDYKESLINSQAAAIAGLYVPQKKTIFLGDWLEPSIAEVVCAHEMAHAFQDKVVGLDKFLESAGNNYDLEFTLKSIIEGDAMAVSFEYLLNKSGESFKDWHDLSMVEDIMFKGSYLRNKVYYNIYGYGAQFIQACLDKYNWQGLDMLYKDCPVSMKEIIDPEVYISRKEFSGKAEENVNKNKLIEVYTPSGWREEYSTTLGEYLLFLSLSTVLDKDLAQDAAFGWEGDKLTVYNNDKGENIFFLLTKWDTDKDTQEFFNAYKQWLAAKQLKQKDESRKKELADISPKDTDSEVSLAEEKKFFQVSNTPQEFMLLDESLPQEEDLSGQTPQISAFETNTGLDNFIYSYGQENISVRIIQDKVAVLWTDTMNKSELKETAEQIFSNWDKKIPVE